MNPALSHWRPACAGVLVVCALSAGCGTTRWSDTSRTATEQLLLSDAIDRAVSAIDFAPLSGRDVYLDVRFIAGTVDQQYLTSTLRQHMLASGCLIKDKLEDATYVVEIRSGAMGTNRNDLLFGVPATNLPSGGVFPVAPTSIPEIPMIKRTAQQGVCKVAVFAYDRMSGQPIWQSGNRQVASKAKDVWIFGTGPFQQGTIYDGTKFAGERLSVPLGSKSGNKSGNVWVSHEIQFAEPQQAPQTSEAEAQLTSGTQPAPATEKPAAGADAAKAGGAGSAAAVSPPPASQAPKPAPSPAIKALPPVNPASSPPAGATTTSTTFNPGDSAVGALKAFDWARTVQTE